MQFQQDGCSNRRSAFRFSRARRECRCGSICQAMRSTNRAAPAVVGNWPVKSRLSASRASAI